MRFVASEFQNTHIYVRAERKSTDMHITQQTPHSIVWKTDTSSPESQFISIVILHYIILFHKIYNIDETAEYFSFPLLVPVCWFMRVCVRTITSVCSNGRCR